MQAGPQMTRRCRRHVPSAPLSFFAALIFAALLLVAGCTSSRQPANLDVRAQLDGEVPGNGTLTLGAANSHGHTVAYTTIRVRPTVRATLTVPAGNYRVAVWLPHARLIRFLMLCSVPATATAGATVTVTLSCMWH